MFDSLQVQFWQKSQNYVKFLLTASELTSGELDHSATTRHRTNSLFLKPMMYYLFNNVNHKPSRYPDTPHKINICSNISTGVYFMKRWQEWLSEVKLESDEIFDNVEGISRLICFHECSSQVLQCESSYLSRQIKGKSTIRIQLFWTSSFLRDMMTNKSRHLYTFVLLLI